MTVSVHTLAIQEVAQARDRIVAVYRDAFGMPPYAKGKDEVEAFARFLPEHVGREGFSLVVAEEEGSGDVLGFAYGHENAPGQGWHEVVARLAPPQLVSEWLIGSFRLAEMAVVTRAQGRGLGGRLHDRLLAGLPYRRAVLSTMAADTNAYRLYRKRGWQVLLDDLLVPGLPRPYRVLGLIVGPERGI
ncbi:MAG TPA: GNAT family N-acetyltransferase [Anaerolineae bacterium]|nr:GNAT family N-acetyltransferase [Anaerolineae bacterium]